MLRRIGFRYAKRIDPFDGGPHFIAAREDVSLIRDTRRLTVRAGTPATSAGRLLVGRELAGPPFYRAIAVPGETSETELLLGTDALAALGAEPGESLLVLAL